MIGGHVNISASAEGVFCGQCDVYRYLRCRGVCIYMHVFFALPSASIFIVSYKQKVPGVTVAVRT